MKGLSVPKAWSVGFLAVLVGLQPGLASAFLGGRSLNPSAVSVPNVPLPDDATPEAMDAMSRIMGLMGRGSGEETSLPSYGSAMEALGMPRRDDAALSPVLTSLGSPSRGALPDWRQSGDVLAGGPSTGLRPGNVSDLDLTGLQEALAEAQASQNQGGLFGGLRRGWQGLRAGVSSMFSPQANAGEGGMDPISLILGLAAFLPVGGGLMGAAGFAAVMYAIAMFYATMSGRAQSHKGGHKRYGSKYYMMTQVMALIVALVGSAPLMSHLVQGAQ